MIETYKTMVEVDCPVGYEVDRHGKPSGKQGEFLMEDGNLVIPISRLSASRVIFRKSFVWPSWLPDSVAAIAKDKDLQVFAYTEEPTRDKSQWIVGGGHFFRLGSDHIKLPHGLEGVPPLESLRLNPNHKSNQ